MAEKIVAFRFGDAELQIRELSIDIIQGIARRNGVSWELVINLPGANLAMFRDVVDAVCGELKVEAPVLETAKDAERVARANLVMVEDDLPPMPEGDDDAENPTPDPSTPG